MAAFDWGNNERPVDRLRNRLPNRFNFTGAEQRGMNMAAALPEMQKKVAERQTRDLLRGLNGKVPLEVVRKELLPNVATGKYEGGKTRKGRKTRKTRKAKKSRRRY